MLIEVSIGEIVDKITILKIKKANIKDEDKLTNINKEYNYLLSEIPAEIIADDLFIELHGVNSRLWQIEDDIRDCERARDFEENFIRLARLVYITNDERAEIKKKINLKYGSEFVEEKSYKKY